MGVFALAVSFGVASVSMGWPAWLVVTMSAIVFAGGAQFALVGAFNEGGIFAALLAALLINLRFVPMGMTVAASLAGGRWLRSLQSQTVVDGSWAIARRSDGSFSRDTMIAASLMQWLAWIAGTFVGAYLTPQPGLISALGLDVIFPAFFLVFVLDSLRNEPQYRQSALAAVLISGAMCLFVPPGVALFSGAAAALLALRKTRRSA